MNFVYLSPHFPPNYYRFCVRLREEGVNVLGLADAPYGSLRPELRGALSEYYRVDDMSSYDALVRALGHFTHRHGKLDGIDSLSEHWLETEARLRTDFNMDGLRQDRIGIIKRKSAMKEIYRAAGIRVARGAVVRTVKEARRLVAETGYPVVAKPDVGVGAAATFKIRDDGELSAFFDRKPPVDYIVEEFIQGKIFSFDGLTDRDGNLVFFTSHAFSQGIMETVNDDVDLFYHSLREIPADLEEAGRRTARAFDVRGRFFHFEFFRAERDGGIVALEVNLRPPGGLTTDMFNYANDIDIYREWARVVAHNRFAASWSRPYHVGYVGRKRGKRYVHNPGEILEAFGGLIVHHEEIDSIFRAAIGDHGYLIRSKDLDEVRAAARYIQETA
ncbi:MAG TPA: ATP-grasp domain-containing protein [Patescibacteria group bacterium]|nr:ATP-grasp domain-containing protein [Patescibacteria group bacterium]